MNKGYSMAEIFTLPEIRQAVELHRQFVNGELHRQLVEKVVRSAMPRINKRTRQKNDENFLADALEWATSDLVYPFYRGARGD